MESVKLIECPRDAWQGLPRQIPTGRKVEYLRGLVAAGFRHIDAVSFVSPKAVPQMADSEAVLEQLGGLDGVEIIGIVVNAGSAVTANFSLRAAAATLSGVVVTGYGTQEARDVTGSLVTVDSAQFNTARAAL